jgi:hypothetical protein
VLINKLIIFLGSINYFKFELPICFTYILKKYILYYTQNSLNVIFSDFFILYTYSLFIVSNVHTIKYNNYNLIVYNSVSQKYFSNYLCIKTIYLIAGFLTVFYRIYMCFKFKFKFSCLLKKQHLNIY